MKGIKEMKKILLSLPFVFALLLTGCVIDDSNTVDSEILTLQDEVSSLLEQISTMQNQIDLLITGEETNQETIDELLLDIAALETELAAMEDASQYVAPVFSNIPGNQIIDYQTDLDLSSLGITALDNIDGDITTSITVDIDDTTTLTMGNHPVTYSVTDSDGNTSTYTINLEVGVFDSTFTYVIIDEGTNVKITGYSRFNSGFLTIPASLGGLPVTEIGGDAFRSKGLIEVTLPDTLVTIGTSAFYDNEILVIDIPSSVLSIGDFAFGRNSLTSILVRSECEHVGESAFRDNNIDSVTIGAIITDIGNDAFTGNAITWVWIFGDETRFDSRWTEIGLPIELLGVQD